VQNFPITGVPVRHLRDFVVALAVVKQAAAARTASSACCKAEAIDRACGLIFGGQYHEQFVVDVIQGGAGTSTNSCSLGHVAAAPAQGSRHDLLPPAGSPDPVKSSKVR
jgi:aspartate ammonia-lyase